MSPTSLVLRLFVLAAALLSIAFAPLAFAAPSFNNTQEWNAVTTFQSIGLYWTPPGMGSGVTATVKFKEAGTSTWRDGLDLWFDSRTAPGGEYRGSIVELKPNMGYDVRLQLSTGYTKDILVPDNCASDTQCTTTWNDNFPVGFTINVPSGTTKVVINAPTGIAQPSGTLANGTYTINVPNSVSAQSYMLVTASPGVEINQSGIAANSNANLNPPCVEIVPGSRYLIVRGLVLKNCQGDGIRIQRPDTPPATLTAPTHHIVMEDNDISGWGGTIPGNADGWPNKAVSCFYWTGPSGTYNANENRPNQIVIQRNRMYSPRYSARNWDFGHPQGPGGVGFERCGQNHVIRYNEVYSTNGHFYMDGLTGAENFGEEGSQGFPWADSDIYGNRISQAYDDAIEAEGASRNVRIWKNYTERSLTSIANATVGIGPLYVWRNVSNTMDRMKPSVSTPGNPDLDSDRGTYVKAGGPPEFNGGRAYYFHNTVLQAPPPAGFSFPLGAGGGVIDSAGTGDYLYNFVSLNNIWHIWKDNWESIKAGSSVTLTAAQRDSIVADYDIYNGPIVGLPANAEASGFRFSNSGTNKPTYAASNTSYPGDAAVPTAANSYTGDFRLKAGALGHGTNLKHAVRINNFNDLDAGDVGAHQSGTGTTLMQFGVAAAPPVGPSARLNTTPSPASGPAPLTVSFSGSNSTAGGAAIAGYSINFGDGSANGSGVTQTHQYTAAGTYTAALTVTDANGLTSTDFKTIQVTAQLIGPTAQLSASPLSGPAPLTVSFNASGSTPGSAPISSYSINFGDGSNGSGVTQSHQYATAGTYVAALTVTDANGNPSTSTKTIAVGTPVSQPPSAFELYVSVNPGLAANRTAGERFDFLVERADGYTNVIQSVRFYIDGVLKATSTAAPFQSSWTTAATDATGNHTLRVEATDTAGNVAIESRNLLLLTAACNALVPSTSVVQGQPLNVQGLCSNTQTVTQMEFYLDGALQGADTNSLYTWTLDTSSLAVGSHAVAVKARLSGGAEANDSITVQVGAAPLTVTFSPGPVLLPTETVTITAAATDGRPLKQMDFFLDGAFKAGTIVPPYRASFAPSAYAYGFGRHSLFIQATDTSGNVLTATRDLYRVTGPCNVLLGTNKYIAGSNEVVYAGPYTFSQGEPLNVRGMCSASQSVAQMEFYLDGTLQSTDTTVPYTWTLSTASLPLGMHTIAIKGRLSPTGESNHSVTIEIVSP